MIDCLFLSLSSFLKHQIPGLVHCKCLQGFTGVLRGNEAAGISNLQGLWVTSKPCKKIKEKQ